jgi:hypothetical protein
MSTNVRKTLTDAGYIAVGLTVMGVQQAQIRGRELRRKAGEFRDCAQARSHDTQAKIKTQAASAQELVKSQSQAAQDLVKTQTLSAKDLATSTANDAAALAQTLRSQVEARVEPAVGKVQTQLSTVPEKVVQAMEPVAARVRRGAGFSPEYGAYPALHRSLSGRVSGA